MLNRRAFEPDCHITFRVHSELAPVCHSGLEPEFSSFLLGSRACPGFDPGFAEMTFNGYALFLQRQVNSSPHVGICRLNSRSKHLQDMFCKAILNFVVSWDRLGHFCKRILIPVVSLTVADKDTTHLSDELDELLSFHPTTSSPTW